MNIKIISKPIRRITGIGTVSSFRGEGELKRHQSIGKFPLNLNVIKQIISDYTKGHYFFKEKIRINGEYFLT